MPPWSEMKIASAEDMTSTRSLLVDGPIRSRGVRTRCLRRSPRPSLSPHLQLRRGRDNSLPSRQRPAPRVRAEWPPGGCPDQFAVWMSGGDHHQRARMGLAQSCEELRCVHVEQREAERDEVLGDLPIQLQACARTPRNAATSCVWNFRFRHRLRPPTCVAVR